MDKHDKTSGYKSWYNRVKQQTSASPLSTINSRLLTFGSFFPPSDKLWLSLGLAVSLAAITSRSLFASSSQDSFNSEHFASLTESGFTLDSLWHGIKGERYKLQCIPSLTNILQQKVLSGFSNTLGLREGIDKLKETRSSGLK